MTATGHRTARTGRRTARRPGGVRHDREVGVVRIERLATHRREENDREGAAAGQAGPAEPRLADQVGDRAHGAREDADEDHQFDCAADGDLADPVSVLRDLPEGTLRCGERENPHDQASATAADHRAEPRPREAHERGMSGEVGHAKRGEVGSRVARHTHCTDCHSTRWTRCGPIPFSSTSRPSSKRNSPAWAASSLSSAETRISPPVAALPTRAARFTCKPKKSSRSRIASPVCRPMRTRDLRPSQVALNLEGGFHRRLRRGPVPALVGPDPLPRLPPQELVDGRPQRPPLDIPERDLNAADGGELERAPADVEIVTEVLPVLLHASRIGTTRGKI